MDKMCYSCGAPLSEPEFKSKNENYCKYCCDDEGNVKSYEEIKPGVAQWLKSWQPDLKDEESLKRAENYLKAMPHWAE